LLLEPFEKGQISHPVVRELREKYQIFRCGGRCYSECGSAKLRDDFAHALFESIETLLDEHFKVAHYKRIHLLFYSFWIRPQ
jgi:hypothetical protein